MSTHVAPRDMGERLEKANPRISGDLENWWQYEDDGVHAESCAAAYQEYLRINAYEGYRLSCNRAWSRWYGDSRYNGFSTVGIEYPSPNVFDDSQSNENVIREIITANWNKLKKNRPQPTVVTSGGQYSDWHTAENIQYWLRGCFAKDKVYDKLDRAQVHSQVFGDGFLAVFDDWATGRPVCKWVPSYEIHVDPVDACDGEPRSIYRIGSLSKEYLASRFPAFKEEIWKAAPFFEELWNIRLWSADAKHLNYLEAWHLPSSPEAKDGRHVLCLPTVTLANELWEADYFPIVKVPCNPQVFGYYSVGLIEDLIAAQRMRNKVQNSIDEHLKLLSSSFWSIKRGANIVKAAISNLIGRAVEYTGDTAPKLNTPEPVSPQLFDREEKLRNQMYQSARTNAAAMSSMKPAGIESGKGLRVYADLEAEGMVAAHQAREDAVVSLAWLYARRAQYMMENSTDERPAKLEIRVKRAGRYEKIDWEDVDLDEVDMSVLPASSLATTLAGKLEDIRDLSDEGIITDVDQKRQLVGMPDIDTDNDISLAPRNVILYSLERIMKHGESITPDPSWDLHTAMDQGLKHYALAQLRGYPESVQQELRNWISECVAHINGQTAPGTPPGAPAATPPIPPGQPGMPVPAGPIAGMPMPAGPPAGPPAPVGPIPGAPQ